MGMAVVPLSIQQPYVVQHFRPCMAPTTDDLEVRICGDETTATEDIVTAWLEIYIK